MIRNLMMMPRTIPAASILPGGSRLDTTPAVTAPGTDHKTREIA